MINRLYFISTTYELHHGEIKSWRLYTYKSLFEDSVAAFYKGQDIIAKAIMTSEGSYKEDRLSIVSFNRV